jgi:hypothetical protein
MAGNQGFGGRLRPEADGHSAKRNPPERVLDVHLLKAIMLLFAASSRAVPVPTRITINILQMIYAV